MVIDILKRKATKRNVLPIPAITEKASPTVITAASRRRHRADPGGSQEVKRWKFRRTVENACTPAPAIPGMAVRSASTKRKTTDKIQNGALSTLKREEKGSYYLSTR